MTVQASTTKASTGTTKASTGTTKASNAKASTGTTKASTGTTKASTGTTKASTGTTKASTGTTKASNAKASTGTTKASTGTTKASTGTTKASNAKASGTVCASMEHESKALPYVKDMAQYVQQLRRHLSQCAIICDKIAKIALREFVHRKTCQALENCWSDIPAAWQRIIERLVDLHSQGYIFREAGAWHVQCLARGTAWQRITNAITAKTEKAALLAAPDKPKKTQRTFILENVLRNAYNKVRAQETQDVAAAAFLTFFEKTYNN